MQVITLILPSGKNSNHFHSLRLITPVFHIPLQTYIQLSVAVEIYLIMHYVLGV